MKNGALLKIIALMVVAVLLIGGGLALTSKSSPSVLSGDALKATLGSTRAGTAAQAGGKDWTKVLSGIKANSLTGQGKTARGATLSDSQMKAVLGALGKGGSSSQQPASGSFSKDSSGSLGKGAEMAGKAFEQMGQNK